ncbi:hypothetical protein HMPREF3190_00987 [Umbribacter vaginalis]|nr:hypothetical protein HMPREF3190_00987 [Coriobacteriales bacterium DNF00809]
MTCIFYASIPTSRRFFSFYLPQEKETRKRSASPFYFSYKSTSNVLYVVLFCCHFCLRC